MWYSARLQPETSGDECTRWLDQLDKAKRLLSEQQPPGWETILKSCHGNEAEIARLMGDTERALKALREAGKLGPLDGTELLTRARVFESSGQRSRAIEDARRAIAMLHPESLEAQSVKELLASLQ